MVGSGGDDDDDIVNIVGDGVFDDFLFDGDSPFESIHRSKGISVDIGVCTPSIPIIDGCFYDSIIVVVVVDDKLDDVVDINDIFGRFFVFCIGCSFVPSKWLKMCICW